MIELNTTKELGGLLFTITDIDFDATIECDKDCFYRENKRSKCSLLKEYRKRGIHCPFFKIHCISVIMNVKNVDNTHSRRFPEQDSVILIDNKGYSYKHQRLCESNLPDGVSDYSDPITSNTQADFIILFAFPKNDCSYVKLRVYDPFIFVGTQYIDFSISDSNNELEQWIEDIKDSMQSKH